MSRLLWVALLSFAAPAYAQGLLAFVPEHGPVGSRVQARASGLPANARLEFVWHTTEAQWSIENTLYQGVKSKPVQRVLTSVTSSATGEVTFAFTVPEDYGHVHNTALSAGPVEHARQGFTVVPALEISPKSGPPGTPIRIKVTGLGYRFYDRGRHLYYDHQYTGWLSAITTRGTAVATVRATGSPGQHLIELMNGPRRGYLNGEQSPNYIPAIPFRVRDTFTVTRGTVVRPPAPAKQTLPREAGVGKPDGGATTKPILTADYRSGTVGSLLRFFAAGFSPNTPISLAYTTVRGNRIGGGGWEETEVPLGQFTSNTSGEFQVTLPTPDDLEGDRVFIARGADREARYAYRITPSVARFGPSPVKPGGQITINLKGTGWTSTGNIYTMLLNNNHIGYACGFNSRGDITITFTAPMQRGWHFIDLYPSIYEGKSDAPTATTTNDHFQLPMLHYQDHPGEFLPAFHLAFEVR